MSEHGVIPSTGSLGENWPANHVLTQGKGGSLSSAGWTEGNEDKNSLRARHEGSRQEYPASPGRSHTIRPADYRGEEDLDSPRHVEFVDGVSDGVHAAYLLPRTLVGTD